VGQLQLAIDRYETPWFPERGPLPGHGHSFDDSVRRTMPTYGHGQFSIISVKGKMSACVSRKKGNPTISKTFRVNIGLLFFTSCLTIYTCLECIMQQPAAAMLCMLASEVLFRAKRAWVTFVNKFFYSRVTAAPVTNALSWWNNS